MTQRAARAFLALWNSISGQRVQKEYETWHSFEHVPERVGLPGFIEARRYRSTANPLRYYTCYWLESADALATPQYRDVFTNPTVWSARIRPQMRDFFRMPCGLGGAHGNSSASRLVTLHLQSDDADAGALIDAALRSIASKAGLVGAQWGPARPTSDFPLANVDAGAAAQHQFVVMLDHLDDAALREATQQLLQALAPGLTPVTPPDHFELLTQVRQDELLSPLSARQPQRPELLAPFIQGDNA